MTDVHVTGARILLANAAASLGALAGTDGEVIGGGLGLLMLGPPPALAASNNPNPISADSTTTPGLFRVTVTVTRCVFRDIVIQTGALPS